MPAPKPDMQVSARQERCHVKGPQLTMDKQRHHNATARTSWDQHQYRFTWHVGRVLTIVGLSCLCRYEVQQCICGCPCDPPCDPQEYVCSTEHAGSAEVQPHPVLTHN